MELLWITLSIINQIKLKHLYTKLIAFLDFPLFKLRGKTLTWLDYTFYENYFIFFVKVKIFWTRFGILFQCSAQLRTWLGGRPRRWEGFSIRGLKRKWSSAFEIHNSSLMVFHFYELKIDNWIFLFTWSYGKNNRVLRMKVTIISWIKDYVDGIMLSGYIIIGQLK